MKNMMEMDPIEVLEMLNILVNDQIFAARERLKVLLNEPPSAENKQKLETEFREFYCGYESLAFFLETYEVDPLEGLAPHTSIAKKLKRHREYIHAIGRRPWKSGYPDARSLHEQRSDAGEENLGTATRRISTVVVDARQLRTFLCT